MNSWVKRGLAAVALLLVVGVGYEMSQAVAAPRPNFTGTDLKGKPWSLEEHRGKRPVLLSFFATWCGPCRQELPHLLELQRKHAELGLQVVLLTREPPELIQQDPQLAGLPVTYLVEASDVFDTYGVDSIPHTVFFDSTGKVQADYSGYDEAALGAVARRIR